MPELVVTGGQRFRNSKVAGAPMAGRQNGKMLEVESYVVRVTGVWQIP